MGWRGPPTLRHLMLWQAWFQLKRDEPGPVGEYVMQLTAELMRITAWLGIRSKNDMPNSLEDLRIKHVPSEAPPVADPLPLSSSRKRRRRPRKSHEVKQAAQWSKMRWHAVLGGGITVRNPDGTLTLPDGKRVLESEYNAARTKAPPVP